MFVTRSTYKKLENKNEELKRRISILEERSGNYKKQIAEYSILDRKEKNNSEGLSNELKEEIVSKLARMYTPGIDGMALDIKEEFGDVSRDLFIAFINKETDLFAKADTSFSGKPIVLLNTIPLDWTH